jgi:hypothetical protein
MSLRRTGAEAQEARTGAHYGLGDRCVKKELGSKRLERDVQIREEVLDVLDSDGNSYKAVS